MTPEENSRALNPADDNKLQDQDNITDAELVSFFNSLSDRQPKTVLVACLVHLIRSGKWKKHIDRLRQLYLTDPEAYTREKLRLSFFLMAGIFKERNKAGFLKPSGFIILDIDGLSLERLSEIRQAIESDQHTALCFLSPSGAGLKIAFRVAINNDAECKAAFSAISEYFGSKYRTELDQSGKDISRACYVSYDPEAYYNPDAVQFAYEVAAVEPVKPMTRPTAPIFIGNHQQRYVLSVINGEIESVETAPRGGGNNALNVAAMKIGQFYYLGLFDKEAIRQHLTAAYLQRGGSFKKQVEADATFESGWRAGVNSPRALPEGGQP